MVIFTTGFCVFFLIETVKTDSKLSLLDSSYGASACAASAIDTLIGIDLELSVTHADCTNGAVSLTCATSNTSITNYICHNSFPPVINQINVFYLSSNI